MSLNNVFIYTSCLLFVPGTLLSSSNSFSRSKRTEIDLQTCINNFNVHRDKIIRTQDSQNMGAKYLNEIDLGSREECLRLCCETEDCDVFVFEEKNSGSCYLFHCGPPEDFKCKFTHHANYSSAVLSINRRLPDLESQIKLTKHVQELNSLRKSDEETEVVRTGPVIPEIRATTTTLAPVITKEVIPMEKQETRKCSRYQFECRSTGECIAIYNACDGIPQCADGSDEAHELGCPAPEAVVGAAAQQTTTQPIPKTPMTVRQPPIPIQQYGREGELVQQQLPPQPQNPSTHPIYHPQVPQIPVQQADQDFLRPIAETRSGQFDPMVPNYMVPNIWGMGRPVGQVNSYQDVSSNLYNHDKLSRNEGQVNQLQYDYNNRGPKYYGESYRQPVQSENWAAEDSRYLQPPAFNGQDNVVSNLPAKTEGTVRVATPLQIEPAKQLEQEKNPKHVQEKLAHDLIHSKENMEHGQTVKTEFAEPYKMIDDSQDGAARIPRGAILSLTFGLIITAVMAILIGCRFRVVRRRLRKGGKGYAHDADYLVNGMYL